MVCLFVDDNVGEAVAADAVGDNICVFAGLLPVAIAVVNSAAEVVIATVESVDSVVVVAVAILDEPLIEIVV